MKNAGWDAPCLKTSRGARRQVSSCIPEGGENLRSPLFMQCIFKKALPYSCICMPGTLWHYSVFRENTCSMLRHYGLAGEGFLHQSTRFSLKGLPGWLRKMSGHGQRVNTDCMHPGRRNVFRLVDRKNDPGKKVISCSEYTTSHQRTR